MTHDGLGKYLSQRITKAPGSTVDIAQVLKDTRTDVVVSYLPVGSEQATKWYVEQILEAGCGFVNCIPVFIAREDYWNNRFVKAGLPIVGDDIKSQVGATIVHRQLARLFHDRGVKLHAHLAAQRRREHGLLQHARARAAGVQEGVQDQRRDLDHGPRPARGRRPRRPVGLRAVADRPQVGAHPARGPGLRRRAAAGRAQARGLGLAELGRHRHRRRPLLQARPEPRRRRPARRPVLLPHEVAALAAPRRRGARADGGVHREVRAAQRRGAAGAGRRGRRARSPDGEQQAQA